MIALPPAARRAVLRSLIGVGVLAGAGLVAARAAAVPALAPPPAKAAVTDMSLGNPRAPVTVMEFASVGCPHCAVWANEVFPAFRAKYIDTGKVRFEFHEMLAGNPYLAAAGFLTARCVAPDKYFQVVDDVFARQEEIGRDGLEAMAKIATRAGLSREAFQACLQDRAALEALQARTQADARDHEVTGTPTFFVGDEKLEGEQSLEALEAAIAKVKK